MLGGVRHDPVAGADAEPTQPGAHPADLVAQLRRGQRDRRRVCPCAMHDRVVVGAARHPQHVLRRS